MKFLKVAVLGLVIATPVFTVSADARDLVVHAGRLIDGVTDKPREKVSILVQDDRIVGSNLVL
ncbi:hypothetical protein [Aminobacter sp. HY435]|uniref:hypothetical protein n=1 Tax=Aminobacter sp. HY435 TaxID=2970917 RepID=UPI0022B973D4|nr:hypothetical protein [Aminobacter sp. HY435]